MDASAAGEGTMEIAINANGRNIPNQAHAISAGKYEVSFVGHQAVTHEAVITYNGHHVPGGWIWWICVCVCVCVWCRVMSCCVCVCVCVCVMHPGVHGLVSEFGVCVCVVCNAYWCAWVGECVWYVFVMYAGVHGLVGGFHV